MTVDTKELFLLYTTFFAISTYTIVENEQQVSDDMNRADVWVQVVFLALDVTINLMAPLMVMLQALETGYVLSLRCTVRDYWQHRFHFIEWNFAVLVGLCIVVQMLRVANRSTPGELPLFQAPFQASFFLIFPIVMLIFARQYYLIMHTHERVICT